MHFCVCRKKTDSMYERNSMLNVLGGMKLSSVQQHCCPPYYSCVHVCMHVCHVVCIVGYTCAQIWSSRDNLYNMFPMYMSRSTLRSIVDSFVFVDRIFPFSFLFKKCTRITLRPFSVLNFMCLRAFIALLCVLFRAYKRFHVDGGYNGHGYNNICVYEQKKIVNKQKQIYRVRLRRAAPNQIHYTSSANGF